MRSLPVRDHWCASFHLATVLAAVGHRSCGRGVCVWCARRSRLRGVDPKPGVRQAPRRQGRGLPPRGLSPGVAHWGKHPEAHTKSTPRSPHRASLFKAAGNHQQPQRQQPPPTTTNATVGNWGVITPHARKRWPCARRNPRQGFRWQPRTHTVAAQRTPTPHTTPGLPQPATTLLHALKTPTLACAAAPLGVSKGGDFGT